ncbi:MAG: hypothetical protein A3K10_16740 [Bacteroidetes bacterium RIFCSPLOWO2_12_FULL_31_6]|nr:MAG: hypothetical protein A3K10_16740 [Bacteroidetes bacterium RIFCSPLOWO2_12_FULL_31_6]
MKTEKVYFILISLILFFVPFVKTNAQIQSFKYEAFKDYNDNTRIAYFYIDGINSEKEEQFVQNELRKNVEILMFSVYPKTDNLNRCMIKTKSALDETIVKNFINKAINLFNQNPNTDINNIPNNFPKYIDTGNKEYDNKIYKAKKEEWIKNHPEEYNKIKGNGQMSEEDMSTKKIKEQTR